MIMIMIMIIIMKKNGTKPLLIFVALASVISVSAANTKLTEKWRIKTSNGSKIPAGWQPFGYDSNDESDPFLLRRSTNGKWDTTQKWEIKTSNGSKISAGWEPFGYDSKDESDPFLIRRRSE